MSEQAVYRGVKVTIWNDEKFFTLSDDGQLVWFHVYTNAQTNGLGLYHATVEGLAANKRWPVERYRKGFGEGLAKGLFVYDETFQVIYFPRYINHNKPANPNVMASLLKAWDYIPNTHLKASVYAALKGLGEPFAKKLANLSLLVPETETVTDTVSETGTGTVIPLNPSQAEEYLQSDIGGEF